MTIEKKIRLGVSSCLLGNEVRYDGGHQYNRYINNGLSAGFDFVAYCPESAIGMGVPRPPIQLVLHNDGVHAQGREDPSMDVSAELRDYASNVAGNVAELSGFILKSASPSCGTEKVKLFEGDNYKRQGVGLFAEGIKAGCPMLPVEDEERLLDSAIRDRFIEHVFLYTRWQTLMMNPTAAALVEFHSRNKFNLMAHSEAIYRQLGPLVANSGKNNIENVCDEYGALMTAAMSSLSNNSSHTNVLMHLTGFLKKKMQPDEKQALHEMIEQYRQQLVPLLMPITLINYFIDKYDEPYLAQLYYLRPSVAELQLRFGQG